MLLSISFILLVGMSMSWICKKIRLPGLLGMLIRQISVTAGSEYTWHFSGFKKNCPDYYSDQSGTRT